MNMKHYNEWPANHKMDNPPNPKIIALGKKITDVAAHKLKGVKAKDPDNIL